MQVVFLPGFHWIPVDLNFKIQYKIDSFKNRARLEIGLYVKQFIFCTELETQFLSIQLLFCRYLMEKILTENCVLRENFSTVKLQADKNCVIGYLFFNSSMINIITFCSTVTSLECLLLNFSIRCLGKMMMNRVLFL